MSSPTGGDDNVIIFVPVRFLPPDTQAQAVFEQYIGVPANSTYADIFNAAVDWLHDFLTTARLDKYRPAAALGDYQIEILPITAIPRASSGQRGY